MERPDYLSDAYLDDLIHRALAEDVGAGDVTTEATVPVETQAEAHFLAKEAGVVAGLEVAERVFAAVDPSVQVQWRVRDGAQVGHGLVFGVVNGAARSLLTGERLALNLLQRMSGVATLTHRMAAAISHHPARLLDTRKTMPGLRLLDKWAVRLGGGQNHRIGLFDLILIKDNHLAATGGVAPAVEAARRYLEATGQTLQIEVEARTLDEVRQVVAVGGVDFILLDNMVQKTPAGRVDASMLAAAVALVDGRVQTEASGNVSLDTIPAIAATGVDFISCGALTHSARALDLSLKIVLDQS